jgi:hypothetical protein
MEKLPPYQRLKTIISEGHETLTDKGEQNLNKILGIQPKKPTLLQK